MTISLAILNAAKETNTIAIPQYHGSPYAYLRKYPTAEKSLLLKRIWATLVLPFKKQKLKTFVNLAKNGIVCVSNGSKKELRALLGTKATEKIITIYNPLDISSYKSNTKINTISFVSRLESKHKNAFLIAKTWELLSPKHPDWHLNIYGEGPLKDKLSTYFTERNIKNVSIKGFVQNIQEELSKSKISLSTSNCEGFSMAIAEAILNQNAIVSTDSDGGIKDMLIHKKTTLISPKNDANKLCENLDFLIKNEALSQNLSDNAKTHLSQITSLNPIEQWKALLTKML